MSSSSVMIFLCGVFLEALSIGFRSISLGFRLFANVAAGHVLCDIFGAAKFLSSSSLFGIVVSSLHVIFLQIYEVGVSVVQTGVFIALLGVYSS